MKRAFILGGALALAAFPAAAHNPAVDAARSAGIAGERFDGYMGFAKPAMGQLRREVGAINIKRRALYARLAQQKGVSPEEVGITAGCTLLARVRAGQAYMLSDAAWRTLAPGAPPPQPPYCR